MIESGLFSPNDFRLALTGSAQVIYRALLRWTNKDTTKNTEETRGMQAQTAYHIYNLPRELLDTLTLRTLLSEPPPPQNTKSTPIPNVVGDGKQAQDGTDGAPASGANTGARACNICLGVTFLDVDEQRTHFRSDWHRYNVKTRLSGGQAVSEEKFAQLVEGSFVLPFDLLEVEADGTNHTALEDSLSGSASSSSEGESSGEGSSDAVNTLINKTKRLNAHLNSVSDDEQQNQKQLPHSPLAWFHSPQHQTQLGIYKTLFPTHTQSNGYLEELKEMQKGGPEGRTWAMFMVAGGHFAGAIVKVGKSDEEKAEEAGEAAAGAGGKRKKPKKPKPEMEVLRHKTFHRYTSKFRLSQSLSWLHILNRTF